MSNYYGSSQSPPPLQHPIPTHPLKVPEPPATPVSPEGYQRFTSSPPQQMHPQQGGINMPYYQPFPTNAANSHVSSPPSQQTHPFNPQFGMWGMNDATAQIGMQLGQSAVAAGQEYMQKNVGIFLSGEQRY